MISKIATRIFGTFSLPCLLLGLLFFAASLTPSLIPRGPEVQGILGGLVTALGYLSGQIIALFWRAADLPSFSGRPAKGAKWVAAAAAFAFFFWVLGSSLTWQNDLRQKMDMEPADALHLTRIIVISVVTFLAAFLVGRIVASLFRLIRAWFYRIMPPRRANVLGDMLIFWRRRITLIALIMDRLAPPDFRPHINLIDDVCESNAPLIVNVLDAQ